MAVDVPRFPNGLFRLGDDGIVEITGGETRVPAADVKAIEVGEPKKGRITVKLRWVSGINNNTSKFLVEEEHAALLDELVAAGRAAGGAVG